MTTNQLEIALNVATRTSGYTRDPYQKYQTNLASRLGYLGSRNLESRCPQGSMGTVSGQDPGDMLASAKRRQIPTATEKGMDGWSWRCRCMEARSYKYVLLHDGGTHT